ncbi:hypothetical protein BJY52DRAFT_1184676 [Lactarius psammicola]|nr:hypothetical protein BJY52DRAFT_1184676 [Lactarius psammicola]
MQHTFRTTLKGIRTPILPTTAVSHRHTLASTCRLRRISTRSSSTNTTSVFKKAAKREQKLPRTTSSSLDPLPALPPPPKGTPPIINTRDLEEYIWPLYSRGWGLTPILPNGNGIPVLRKRFEFASADTLQEFLADLTEYEEKKQHHAKTNIFEDQHSVLVSTWTHVARKQNLDANSGGDTKMQGVTARDIRLAYALEKLFESALATNGEDYVPRLRPEADRPRTLEELEGYS